MGSHQTPPLENRHAQALRVGEVGGCTGPAHLGLSSSVAGTLQHFTGNPSPLVFGAPVVGYCRGLGPTQATRPTPWIAIAFPSRFVRRSGSLFR